MEGAAEAKAAHPNLRFLPKGESVETASDEESLSISAMVTHQVARKSVMRRSLSQQSKQINRGDVTDSLEIGSGSFGTNGNEWKRMKTNERMMMRSFLP